jgi:hypothetical protein
MRPTNLSFTIYFRMRVLKEKITTVYHIFLYILTKVTSLSYISLFLVTFQVNTQGLSPQWVPLFLRNGELLFSLYSYGPTRGKQFTRLIINQINKVQ